MRDWVPDETDALALALVTNRVLRDLFGSHRDVLVVHNGNLGVGRALRSFLFVISLRIGYFKGILRN